MNKVAIGIIGAIGLILVIAGSVVLGIFPTILRQKIKEQLPLNDNETDAYDRWADPKAPITMSFHIFSVNNSHTYQNISDIELIKTGPFVYKETRTKTHVNYSDDNNLIRYKEKKEYEFLADKSTGHQQDTINIINFPILGVLDNVVYLPGYGALIFNQMEQKHQLPENETGFLLETTPAELLFDGIHYRFFENEIINSIIKTDKFSINDGRVFEEEPWVIKTGKADIDNIGQLVEFNNTDKLVRNDKSTLIWNNDSYKCNNLEGTDGTFFKPNIQKEDTLYVFEPQLCRTVYFTFSEESEVQGISTYRFIVPQSYFQSPVDNPANGCYDTTGKGEYDQGELNIGSCDRRSLGANIIMSPPYFFHGNDSRRHQFKTELKPDLALNEENYGTYLDIEPMTGTVLRAVKRMQMSIKVAANNILMENPSNSTEEYVIPVFYIEEMGEATEDQANEFKSMVTNKKKIANGVSIGVVVVGGLMVIVSVFLFCRR